MSANVSEPDPVLPILPYDDVVWRLLRRDLAEAPATPAAAATGRFHHSGQVAAYASLTPEGAGVAIRRYLADGVARVLIPMRLTAARVADVRGLAAASIVWQAMADGGGVSPTWGFSDAARRAGAQAMLYSSRSRPDLSHVVVFDPACLHGFGRPRPYLPD